MIRNLRIHERVEFWVLLPLFMVILPHYPRLPSWVALLLPCFFIWRFIVIKQPRFYPARWLLSLIAFLALADILLHYGTIFVSTSSSCLLWLLLVV